MRIRGLHASPDAPQAHQIVAASSPSLQRVGSSAKAIALLCPGDERAGVEAIFGEEGRAFELKAQSLSNPSPPSDTTVGCKLKGPSGLGQNLGGTKPSGMEVWSRREENATRKGKAPVVQMRDSTQEEETIVSKKMWSTLFPPSIDHRQEHQSSSEPLLLRVQRRLAKFTIWKRISGQDLKWNEESERILSFIVNCHGTVTFRGKRPRRSAKKTRKV